MTLKVFQLLTDIPDFDTPFLNDIVYNALNTDGVEIVTNIVELDSLKLETIPISYDKNQADPVHIYREGELIYVHKGQQQRRRFYVTRLKRMALKAQLLGKRISGDAWYH